MPQERNDAYRKAEEKIEQARRSGAKQLDLSGMGLTEVPEVLGKLTALRVLDLSRNHLTTLSEALGKLTALRELDLSRNQLTTLPAQIGNLLSLVKLDVQTNRLIALPRDIENLKGMRTIWLNNNELASLPHEVFRLVALEDIGVWNNMLATLPNEIGKLAELTKLNLERNKLTALPETLRKLTKLEELFLHENPGLGLPTEVLGNEYYGTMEQAKPYAQPAAILDYYFRTRGVGQARPLNEFKLILVGRGLVGKTTLVHQLVHGEFVQQHKTKGISVSDWEVKDGAETITAHIWDFGGQEIMHGTHQFFLTERALYVLVLAGREDREDEDAEYWLKMIGAFGGNAPVFVVLNKIREHPFEVDEEALREKYPNIAGFYETDCVENVGIAKLRKAIEARVPQMEDVKKVFPAAWYVIKQRLPERAANFISFDDYRKVCAELGEKDAKGQEQLAHFLHILGIALNYRDDARLSETSVLNPHWVTGGIYALINDRTIMERHGVLRRSDLARVLPVEDYPKEKHDFLLLLMKKFELCFPLDDEQEEWLVPDLLSKKGPKLGKEFDQARALCFEYRYESLLPPGLLPRFISRAYTRVVDDLRWRTGVIVTWAGAKALVRADMDAKRVEIRLHGSSADMQEALVWVRGHFNEIHGNFKNLNPQEYVRMEGNPGIVVHAARLARAIEQNKEEIEVNLGHEDVKVSVSELAEPFFGRVSDGGCAYPVSSDEFGRGIL